MQPDWSDILLQPLYVLDAFLFSGQARFFWLYTLTGIAIGYLVHRLSGDKTPFHRVLFAREAWLSRSAINDYGLVVINPFVKFLALTWVLTHFKLLIGGGFALIEAAGVTGKATGMDTVFVSACLTLSLFLVDDFLRWALHYIEHRVPVLWEFHKVHHSAESLNFITAERFHPVEMLFLGKFFALGAALAGLAGALVGAIQSVQVGMGEPVLILAFVVIVIGGIGSIKGAFIGALMVGLTDTLGKFLLPELFKLFLDNSAAQTTGSALASMLIYILMAIVLIWRPQGLFGVRA